MPRVVSGARDKARRCFWHLLCLGLSFLFAGHGAAAPQPIEVAQAPAQLALIPGAELLEDPGSSLSLAQVREASGWRQSLGQALNFGTSASAWWLRLRLHNSAAQVRELVVDLGTTQLDFLDWYVLAADDWQPREQGRIGVFVAFEQRPLPTRTLAVPVRLEAGQTRDVYLHFRTQSPPYPILPVSLYERGAFLKHCLLEELLFSGFHGMLLLMIILGLPLFAVTRHPAVGLYVLYLTMFLGYSLADHGFDLSYLWHDSPLQHRRLLIGASMLSFITGNGFAIVFMRLHTLVSRRLLRAIQGLLLANLAGLPLLTMDQFGMVLVWDCLCGMSLTLAVFGIMVLLSLRGVRDAGLICLAYSGMVVTLSLYLLQLYGLMPASRLALWGIQGAAMIWLLPMAMLLVGLVKRVLVERERTQVRESMVSFLSHDIRAPQSAILALLEMQVSTGLLAQNLRESIEPQVRRTLKLIDALLWFSRAESAPYRFEKVFLGNLVHEAIDQLWPLARYKCIVIERRGLDNERCQVRADRELLTRAICNLLENAVKYSRPATVIRVGLDIRGGKVLLSIRDSGIGIAEENCARLFDAFYRGGLGKREQGHGLGLAFVASVVERHEAQITCTSEVAVGTTFTLVFPHSALSRLCLSLST